MSRPDGAFNLKYRPQTFDEIHGNKDTVATIQRRLKEPTRPHVILFCGERGTGKTTLARIIRKELECGPRDFKELNAANTRGIDTVREIYDISGYAPVSGKTRVFLLDECHMVTKPAQESLLKITEDAPKHVFFIFSTTNPEMLIPALRSRCETYKLELLPRRDMVKLLNWVLAEEKYPEQDVEYFKEVVFKIAKVSGGCPREALVMLNQAVTLKKTKLSKCLTSMWLLVSHR